MEAQLAALALEFEVLVGRGARLGALDVAALMPCYAAWRQALGGAPEPPRQVDLEALLRAVLALPAGLHRAPRLLLVPALAAFGHTPVGAGAFRCGALADGTVLGEAHGSAALLEWALLLCQLQHEATVAARLRAAAALPPPTLPLPAAAAAALGFALGADEARLQAALEAGGTALLAWLAEPAALPPVAVHAALTPATQAAAQARAAEQMVQGIAELGLSTRPLHVWIGSRTPSDCLSPYCRELRPLLWTWAEAQPQALGDDLRPLPAHAGEDLVYAIQEDFLRLDPGLAQERAVAERTVGIHALPWGDGQCEAIDLGRLEPQLCDARLPAWRLPGSAPAPVLLRLADDDLGRAAAALRHLLAALGGQVASLTVALPGHLDGGGELALPQQAVHLGGGHVQAWPGGGGLQAAELAGVAAEPPLGGAALCASSTQWGDAATLRRAFAALDVRSVVPGGQLLLQVVQQAVWQQRLGEGCAVTWLVVRQRRADSGRAALPTQRATAAAALAWLRRILLPAGAPPPPAAPPAAPGRRSAAWNQRLRA